METKNDLQIMSYQETATNNYSEQQKTILKSMWNEAINVSKAKIGFVVINNKDRTNLITEVGKAFDDLRIN